MAYTLNNKCAKNLCKRTVLVQLITKNVVTCFLEHSVDMIDSNLLWNNHIEYLYKQVYRRRYESRRSSAQYALKNKKNDMAKNDFQYGGWNYFSLQCGTIMTLLASIMMYVSSAYLCMRLLCTTVSRSPVFIT